MDLKQLEQFITVVNEGNISRAARALHMSQPPLSTQIHALEEELGCTLFIRGPRNIQLTEAGRILYNRSTTLLKIADITKSELLDYQMGTHGTIRIGVVSSVGCTVLNRWISTFHKMNPDICFEIFEANTYELLEQLKSNIIELAIVRTPFNNDSFDCQYLYNEPMMVVGYQHFFANKENKDSESISLKDIASMPLIIYRRWESILRKLFEKYNLHPLFFCINDDAKTTVIWADAGLGIAITPASTLTLINHPNCISMQIDEKSLESTICVISNEHGFMSAGARLFKEHIQTHLS